MGKQGAGERRLSILPYNYESSLKTQKERNIRKKILVVDDEWYTRWFLSKVLTEEGFDVRTTGTGREALQMAPEYMPDLVILDLRLPDMHGIEVLRTMRKMNFESRIIILTAFGTPEVETEAKRLGVDAFISKPYILDNLIEHCKKSLEATRGYRFP
ncbi:MAG: response regulator [Thermodesulfovibrionales bacterium]|nr:response regulator [Thermodesulfovibrionales bacterium]